MRKGISIASYVPKYVLQAEYLFILYHYKRASLLASCLLGFYQRGVLGRLCQTQPNPQSYSTYFPVSSLCLLLHLALPPGNTAISSTISVYQPFGMAIWTSSEHGEEDTVAEFPSFQFTIPPQCLFCRNPLLPTLAITPERLA